MSAIPLPRPKLALLIPRLGSTFDGEILATVQAIKRTLAGAGLDLHALAQELAEEPTLKTVIVYRDRPAPATNGRPTWDCLDRSQRLA